MDRQKIVKIFISKVLHNILRISSEDISILTIKQFLELGADLNLVDCALLHHATSNGYIEVTKLLLENGVNVNAQDKHQMTALHMASEKGLIDIVDILT